jgi:hypothetical protein
LTFVSSRWAWQLCYYFALQHAQEFGLDRIILLSHTPHALHPLNVSCFKPFKTTFKNVRNVTMSKGNHMEPNKIFLARWVDQSINQSLTKKNIKFGFKATCTWPFNPKAMDNKTWFLKIALQQISTTMEVKRNHINWKNS